MAKPKLRKAWRKNWWGSLEEMADVDMQRSTWLNPDNCNPHYSFVEYVECYFDGLVLNDSEGGYSAPIAEGLLTTEEARAVERFHQLLNVYEAPNDDDYDHNAILADERWLEVIAAAQSARLALSEIITDPAELSILFEPSIHARLASERVLHPQSPSA